MMGKTLKLAIAIGLAMALAAPAGATYGSSNPPSSTGGSTSGGSTSGGTEVPEPADFALFGLGVLGLMIGRRSSQRRRTSEAEA